ncbi:MAG: leucine-rich repeat domain-containing protein, partial [Kofleriaceae bacterium]|nr:leucine-rich repeat domain-containing protein [Kofleriaceae bacterium]
AQATLQQFEHLGDIDDGQDNHLRRVLGGLWNLQGLAQRNLGKPAAMASFERAYQLGDQQSRLNLIEAYCYETAEYEKAQKLSRFPTYDDDIWFFKVKVDAYASIMLGDLEQAEKCYRLLHKRYLRKEPQHIDTVRRELADAGSAGAAILVWFGVGTIYSTQQKKAQRRWWNELEPNWQKQLRILLTNKSGAAHRKKAALATDQPTEGQLAAIFETESLSLHSEYPVLTLKPLLQLKALRQFRASYCKEMNCLKSVGLLTELRTLSLAGNNLGDASFLSGLVNLEVLDMGGNDITDVTMLGALTKLQTLNLARSTLGHASLSVLATMTGLRKLSLRLTDSVSNIDPLASLGELEDLTIRGHGITSLASLSNCRKLVDLDVSSNGLIDIEVLGELKTLTDINLGNCTSLGDISVLSRLSKLRKINLAFTSVTDLRPLAACNQLRRIEAYFSHEKPVQGIRELMELPDVSNLTLSRESLPYTLQKELEATRPGVLDVS